MLETLAHMPWQDWVLGMGQLLFFIALIPSIRSPHKPALATAVMTALALTAFVFTFATLGLWFSGATVFLAAIGWYILAYQAYKQQRAAKRP